MAVWRLKPTRYPSHARLRAAVFARDKFSCVRCGASPQSVPVDYDGRKTLYTERRCRSGYRACLHVDHKLALCNGGTNDFGNLQTLCECCNAAKAGR